MALLSKMLALKPSVGRCMLVAGLMLAAMAAPARAETLAEALSSALASNTKIAIADLDAQVAAVGIDIASAGYRPNITADLTGSASATSFGTTQVQLRGGFEFRQMLFDSFLTDANVAVAEAEATGMAHQSAGTRQQVLLAVVRGYYGLVRDRAMLDLAERNVANIADVLRGTEEAATRGDATRIEVSQALARLAQSKGQLELARQRVVLSTWVYTELVGHAPGRLTDGLGGRISAMPLSLEDAINEASQSNPFVQSALSGVSAAIARVDVAKAQFGPKLNLTASVCALTCFGIPSTSDVSGTVALHLTVPLYSGGAEHATVQRANLERQRAEVQLAAAFDATDTEVITAWAALESNRQAIVAARAVAAASREVLDGLARAHQLGEATTIELLNASADVIGAEQSALAAQAELVVAQYGLLAAVGRLDMGDDQDTPDAAPAELLPVSEDVGPADPWTDLRG